VSLEWNTDNKEERTPVRRQKNKSKRRPVILTKVAGSDEWNHIWKGWRWLHEGVGPEEHICRSVEKDQREKQENPARLRKKNGPIPPRMTNSGPSLVEGRPIVGCLRTTILRGG